MKTSMKTLLAAALAGAALFTALPASADGRGDWDDHGGRHEWRGHGWSHHKHWDGPRYVERERVVIRERAVPVYRDYYYEAPVRYYEAPPVRYYEAPRPVYRNPAIVVGVDIPPLVIPLR